MATSANAEWIKEDSRRMLHAVYRVGDMQKTIDCYKNQFGMELLRSVSKDVQNPYSKSPSSCFAVIVTFQKRNTQTRFWDTVQKTNISLWS